MVIDAQIQSPPIQDVRSEESRTNITCTINRTVKILDYKGVLWTCGLRGICLAALWLPLGALIFCYVTASIFQADDIHETHCRFKLTADFGKAPWILPASLALFMLWSLYMLMLRLRLVASFATGTFFGFGRIPAYFKVYNVVPSISAITGISPQRYVWRICIAFHLGPRLLIGSLYYNYHKERTEHIIDDQARKLATKLGEVCYWLNLVELFALTGVTYVSNRENYYVHEKIFIVFMISALVHMLCRAKVGCVASDSVEPVRTNKLVWYLFYISIGATAGLIVHFLRHRLLCRPLAFTWFSVCEYILATANMAFHAMVVRDLPMHQLQVLYPTHSKNN